MNVVAVLDVRSKGWVWRIVDVAGNELPSAGTDYPTMEEALRAGAAHRERLAGRRPPIVRQPIQGRRPRPRP